MKRFEKFSYVIALFVSFCLYFSCNVGLGEAVDTQPPTLSIESPSDGLIIMNTFTMQGSTSDETSVASVQIKLIPTNETSGTTTYGPFDATVDNKKKTWTCNINSYNEETNAFEILDGEYTAEVIATDSAGRTTAQSRVYKIDNTEPVVILSRPTMSDQFGKTVKVTGDIADNNSLSALYFSVYKKNGDGKLEFLETIKKENISGTGLEIVLAQKIDEPKTEEEIELNTLYDKFYPNGQTDDVELYCIVEVSDSAEESIVKGSGIKSRLRKPNGGVYEPSASENLKGNLSTCYYLNNTIYQTVLGGGYKLSKSQLVTVFNGTYARNGIAEETATQVKKYLSENSIQTKDSSTLTVDGISMFRLNPNNSPLYEVPGYKYGSTSDNSFTNIYNGESLQLTVSSGTDGYALVPESIRVVLKECDDFGKEVEGAKEIVLLESKENIEKLKTTDPAKYEEQLAKYEKITSNKENWSAGDSSIRIRVEIGNQKVKTNYLVKVQGRDIAGSETEASGGAKYGIRVIAITSKPPVVVVSKPADGEAGSVSGGYSNTAKLDVTGTFEYSAEIVDIYYRLYALKSEGDSGDSEYYFPLKDAEFNKDAQAADESKCDYRTLKDGAVENCYKKLPTLKFDEGKKSGTWSILNSDAALSEEFKTTIENFCAKIPDATEYTLYAYFIAHDDENNDSEEKEWNIHIDKILPTAEINSVNPVVERNGLDCNVNGIITVQGTASDNDKIATTKLSLFVGNADTDSNGKFVSWKEKAEITSLSSSAITENINSGDKFKYSIDSTKLQKPVNSSEVPNKEWLEILTETTDRAGNKNTASQIVYIDQETDIPLLSSTNITLEATEDEIANNVNLFGMGLNKINLVAEDDDGVKSVSYSIDGGAFTTIESDGKTSKSVEIKLPEEISSGVHKIEFTVEDTQGEINKNIKPLKTAPTYFAVDNDTPVFSDIKVIPDGTAEENAKVYVSQMYFSSKYKLVGNVADSNSVVLVYEKGDESKTNLLQEGKQSWTYEQKAGETDGEKTKAFVAKDKYGRESETTLKYRVDSQAPTFVENTKILFKYGANGEVDSEKLDDNWITNNSITLTGKVSDNIELGDMKLTINGTETPFSSYSGKKDDDFKLLSDSYSEGSNQVVLDIFDGAGNKLPRTFNVKVDSVIPTISSVEILNVDSQGKIVTKNNFVHLKVSASDKTSGLANIIVAKQSLGTDSTIVVLDSEKELYEGQISVNIETWNEGEHTLYVRAIDKAGLVSEEYKIEGLIIDRSAPKVAYTSHKNGAVVNKTITLEGTVSDSNLSESASPVLWYRKSTTATSSAQAWKEADFSLVGSAKLVSDSEWTISNFDTTVLFNELSEGGCNYDFQVRFTDLAGNTTGEDGAILKLNIDQNSDRPKIELNSINIDGTTRLNSGTVAGRIEDDDGDVKELWIKTSKYGTFVEIAITNSTWSYDLPQKDESASADGNYELYFKVLDGAGSTFETKLDDSDGLDVPYIYYQQNKTVKSVKFSVDTTAPEISGVEVSFDGGATYISLGNNQKFGGTEYKNAKFKVNAKDSVTSAEKLIVKLELDNGFSTELPYNDSEKIYECTLDCTSITSGIYQLKITATDEAKMTQSFSKPVIIDNTAPNTIRNVAPKNSDTAVTGEFDFSGLIQDDEDANSGIKDGTLSYYIPKYGETNPESSSITEAESGKSATTGWKKVEGATSVSWKIEFKTLAKDLGYDDQKEELSSDYNGYKDSSNKDLFNIPIWFRVEDLVGNVGYITDCVYMGESSKKPIQLKFNPNADKPTAQITYPEHNYQTDDSDLNGYVILGGTVRFAGTASDNEGIEAVYLQFDMDGDGIFENGMKEDGSMIKGCPFTADKVVEIPVKGEKGVKVEKGTISWSYSLDVSKLTGLSLADNNKVLKARACAVDSDSANGQLASAWSNVINISVNNSVPQVNVEKLKQYASSDSALQNPTKEISYTDGDYISGENWYLEGYFEDSDGIDLAETFAEVDGTTVNAHFEKADVTDTEGKKYTFKIPVSSNSGSCNIKLVVKDRDSSNPQTTERNYTVKIDNTAPDFDEGNGDKLVLYKNNYGTDGIRLDDSSNFIQDSNGSTTIAARVKEADSGFARAVFYFSRSYKTESGTPVRVFNVKEDYGSDRMANRSDIVATKQDGKVYINDEGLAVLYKKNITRANSNDLSFTGLGSNKNIRNAGLVKIGGAYRKIKGITGDTLTLENECSENFTEAEFVYGMVVDNNDNGTVSKDDGDGMAESYSKTGNYYIWDATINSTNISDGPITVNVVVFDKAGNCKKGSVETRISNSPVRITSVKLATDLNSNGTFEESEYQQFYAFKNADGSGNTAKGTDVWNLDTKEELYGNSSTGKYWAVRDRLAVVPEFVGGTAPFYWNFTKDETGANLTTAKTLTASTKIKIENKEQFVLENLQINDATGEGKDVTYQFSFWDSTEELTPGSDTSWTVLNAHVKQELSDSVAPTVTIRPFYWNSSSDNSLYKNSKDEGHIELESDLDFTGSTFTQTSGLYDKDPKVSGIIKIQGTANDNKILKDISVKISGLLDSFTVVGSYTTGSGWNDSTESEVETKLAKGNSWAFTVDEEAITQEGGHTIKWTLTVDTSKITGVAATDVQVQVKASDQKGKSSTEQTTQTAQDNETSFYRMDVVPYISALHTTNRNKSGLKDNNIRSALGKYSIIKGSTSDFITVEGFNLAPNAVRLVSTDDLSNEVTTSSGISLNYTAGTSKKFTISNSISKSGYLEVFTEGIRALNNINGNDAHGNFATTGKIKDYADMPNREADYYSTKNVILTDDRYLLVFDMKETPIKNGYYPTMVMNGNNPVFGYIDLNGINEKYRSTSVPSNGTFGYINGCYQTQKAEFVAETGAIKNGNIDYMFGTIQSDQVAFAKDSAGKYYYASVYNYYGGHMSVVYDSYAENHTWYYYGTRYDGWGDGVGYSDYEGDYVYNSNNNAISLEATNYGNGLLIGRYQNLRMLAKGDSTISTGASVYMAYYDDNTTNKDVIFRTFKVGKNKSWSNRMQNGIYSNLPDQNTSGRISVGTNASSYLDLGVTSDNHVVIVYYDLSEACLKLKYSSAAVDGSSITPNVTWKESSIKFPDYVGAYVSLAIDSENHIHIAAFDSSDSDLTYFYIDRYDSTVCLQEKIDQANSVGQWTRIALDKNNIPYIAYYNSTETGSRETIKLAYANSVGAQTVAGVDDSGYTTGSWEYITVPSITPAQGGDSKFKNVNLDFDTSGTPVVGYLGTNIEFGKWLTE